jgi:hypothetical protein
MPDVCAVITDVEPAVVERVAAAMEVSAVDPQHPEMVRSYLGDLALDGDARVFELRCGTGAISRSWHAGLASAKWSAWTPRRSCSRQRVS